MVGKDFRVIIRNEETFDGMALWIMTRDESGVYSAKPMDIVMEKVDGYPMLSEPTLRFQDERGKLFLQQMANELARMGFMPDKLKEAQDELKATQRHLEDMRALVFKTGRP